MQSFFNNRSQPLIEDYMPEPLKTVYVCPKCGTFYTEHVPADEGTAPCDCGAQLVLIAQNNTGVVTLDQVIESMK